jgi:hypothetical protein
MASVTEIAHRILANAQSVLFLDTCNLLDLLHLLGDRKEALAKATDEFKAAHRLSQTLSLDPNRVWVVLPELIQLEWKANIGTVENEVDYSLKWLDVRLEALQIISTTIGSIVASTSKFVSSGLLAEMKKLAEEIISRAYQLDRDQPCVDRAFQRVLDKRRPSHNKEIKDSINFEQCLAVTAELRVQGYAGHCVFASSNTKDFAGQSSSRIHPDLEAETMPIQLEYANDFTSALRSLKI